MSVRWDCCKISLQAPPLDYSFRGISFIQDLLTEEPRTGLKVIKRSAGGKLLTQAVRLNNNTINELTDFASTMEQLLEYPDELSWVDLSFNDLSTIDPVLTMYPDLRALNLHGNSIQNLGEVDKLAVLPRLRTLTLHGNPIEEEKGYSLNLSRRLQEQSWPARWDVQTITAYLRHAGGAVIWSELHEKRFWPV
uniref:Leucine-rich repeat-containing protein 51 n=1 Tax=Chrysemys picta bellii TaxID=8478 RepID=A0A8C3FG79_CHRPI